MIEAYSDDQWVTLWSAVTAIATSVAALAAIVAGVYAARAYRKERESLQQLKLETQARIERDRRAQAALVTA